MNAAWLAPPLALLAAAPSSDGWIRVFDGETLSGWTTTGGRYDGDAVWTVEDGAIVGREGEGHAGGLLYTEREYASFEVQLDAWISYPFDSGIFVRMRPDVKGAQLTLDYRPDGEIGGVYSDGWYFHNPDAKARWRRDDWNRVRVRCAGDPMHLSMWLNDELVTDYRIPEGSGDFARTGRIGLQVHGGSDAPPSSKVMFRDVRVRELPAGAGDYWRTGEDGLLALTAAGEAAGWRALFNGRDLTGWEPGGSGYRVADGELQLLVEGTSQWLATERTYRDFQLRLDFKIARMANSGVFLRAARDGSNPAFSGAEVQILDDFHWEEGTGSRIEDYQLSGALYAAVPPGSKDALRPVGEWNTYHVTYRGSRIVTVLNGVVLYDVDTRALEPSQGPPFAERAPAGFIGLQRHAPAGAVEGEAYAWFRNVYVREL